MSDKKGPFVSSPSYLPRYCYLTGISTSIHPWRTGCCGFSSERDFVASFVVAVYFVYTPHSAGFVRFASGALYAAIALATFYEIINFGPRCFYVLILFVSP
ncbi:MAG: hypothetical protein NTY64_10610 [Deltaproteobacteria bacterium]|nr:hypothetical protein [Deltaproteobacteria bacterium]